MSILEHEIRVIRERYPDKNWLLILLRAIDFKIFLIFNEKRILAEIHAEMEADGFEWPEWMR